MKGDKKEGIEICKMKKTTDMKNTVATKSGELSSSSMFKNFRHGVRKRTLLMCVKRIF